VAKIKQIEPDESIFDQTGFLDYLKAQPEQSIVGLAATACDCPLARWLEALGYKVAVQSKWVVFYSQPRVKINLPEWAVWFTLTLDVAGLNTPCIREQTIKIVEGIKCQVASRRAD